MAHNVEGKIALVEGRNASWHGLHRYLKRDASLEEWLEGSSTDRTYELAPAFTCTGPKTQGGKLVNLDQYRFVRRVDDGQVYAPVSPGYCLLQPRDVFETVRGCHESVVWESAGMLRSGAAMWVQGKIGETEVIPGDLVNHMITVYQTWDLSALFELFATEQEVVCDNTMTIARSSKSGLAFRHTASLPDRVRKTQEAINTSLDRHESQAEFYRALAGHRLKIREWDALVNKLVPIPEKASKRASTNAKNVRERLEALLVEGKGQDLPGKRGTLWAARSAITDYVSHEKGRNVLNTDKSVDTRATEERRFVNQLMGAGMTWQHKADGLLEDMLSGKFNVEDDAPAIDAQDLMAEIG